MSGSKVKTLKSLLFICLSLKPVIENPIFLLFSQICQRMMHFRMDVCLFSSDLRKLSNLKNVRKGVEPYWPEKRDVIWVASGTDMYNNIVTRLLILVFLRTFCQNISSLSSLSMSGRRTRSASATLSVRGKNMAPMTYEGEFQHKTNTCSLKTNDCYIS